MADNQYWNGSASSAWSTAGNWGVGVPIATDLVYIIETSSAITSVPSATNGVDYGSLTVGPNFTGSIASSALPLYVGSVATITFDGLRCSAAYIAVDTGDTVATFKVLNTGTSQTALVLSGAGTITNLIVSASRYLEIAAGPTITNLHIIGDNVDVKINASATVTNVYQAGGRVHNYAAITTINRVAGEWLHLGDTTFNVGTLNNWGGTFQFASEGGTVTTGNVYGGTLQLNAGPGTASRAITTLNQYGGMVDKRGVGSLVTIGTANDFGGISQTGT